MKKLSVKGENVLETVILVLAVVIAFIFWNTYAVYPIKLFVVLLHEISHGIVVVCSGGIVKEIEADYQLGGYCISHGGNEFVSAISGYLGSLLFGSLMFISAANIRACKFVCYVLSFLFLSVSIFYIKGLFGILFSISFSIILFLITILPISFFRRCFIKILGMLSCLYILFDIKNDLITNEYRNTDALALEKMTGIPSLMWGIIIFIITMFVIFLLLKFHFKKCPDKPVEVYEEPDTTVEEEK